MKEMTILECITNVRNAARLVKNNPIWFLQMDVKN